jgi:hypothetical protein
MLNELNIDIQRKSMDHRKNYFGNLLLEFCKYNNMFICNGRMCNDKGVGKSIPSLSISNIPENSS